MANPATGEPSVNTSLVNTGTNTGTIQVGFNNRLVRHNLNVTVSPGDPASLDRLAEQIRFEPRPRPVASRERDFPGLLGRGDAVGAIQDALGGRRSVAVFGEDGIGKTVLLRHLARRMGDGFDAGVTFLSARDMQWQDLAQEVVGNFFSTSIPFYYLGPSRLADQLGDLPALLLIDDVGPTAGIDRLVSLAAEATFVVAAETRLLAGESRAVQLRGIDPATHVDLIRQTLADLGPEAVFGDEDVEAARRIGSALTGQPRRIIRAVEDAHLRGMRLIDLAAQLEAGPEAVAAEQLARLTPGETAIVDAMRALDGAAIGRENLANQTPTADADVASLERKRVLRAASPQLRLDADFYQSGPFSSAAELDMSRSKLAAQLIRWAASKADSPSAVAAESEAILSLLDWAVRSERFDLVRSLVDATEGAFALAGRWGTWRQVTSYSLQAAEQSGDMEGAAVALNQGGVQELGDDRVERARAAFEQSIDRAMKANAPAIAEVARHNLEVITGVLPPPNNGSNGRARRGDHPTRPWYRRPQAFFAAGGLVIIVVLLATLLAPRGTALAIEPSLGRFAATSVASDGDTVIFIVTNRGDRTLENLSVELSNPSLVDFHVVGGDCPGRDLAVGSSCRVEVLFHPVDRGIRTTDLVVTARDGTTTRATIDGEAVEASASVVVAASSSAPTATPTIEPPTVVVGSPDLAIGRFSPSDVPKQSDFWEVPVEIEIVNAGDADAEPFRIAITADGKLVPFLVPYEDPLRLLTRDRLAAKGRLPYSGIVQLPRDTDLESVRLVVEADSCIGDTNPPDGCRIAEPKELNNSLALQAADVRLDNLVVGERQPPNQLDDVFTSYDVPMDFEIRNVGKTGAANFVLTVRVNGEQVGFGIDGTEYGPESSPFLVQVINAGGSSEVRALVHEVPATNDSYTIEVVVGCPAATGADSCSLPEIAAENNRIQRLIPRSD